MTKLNQKVDFTNKTIQLGMDVHLNKWNVAIFLQGEYIRTIQQPSEPAALLSHLHSQYPGANYVAAYEAGFCGFWIQRQLTQLGINCIVVNAADVPQTSKGRLAKNDTNDARRIGEALCGGLLKPVFVPDTTLEADRTLVRYRHRLQEDITRCKVRIKCFLHFTGIDLPDEVISKYWSAKYIEWLKNIELPEPTARQTLDFMIDEVEALRPQLLKVMRGIRSLLSNERYSQTAKYIKSVCGIGPITAVTLLTEVGDIKRFATFNKFNSFIGLCPSEFSSGETIRHGHMTTRHHYILRSLLIEVAWVAIKADPAMSLAYNTLKTRIGGKRAIIRIARKLLNRIYYCWKRERIYEKGIVQ